MTHTTIPQPPTRRKPRVSDAVLTHCPRPGCGRELTNAERGLTAHVGSCSACLDPAVPHWINFGREWVKVPAGLNAAEFEAWLDDELAATIRRRPTTPAEWAAWGAAISARADAIRREPGYVEEFSLDDEPAVEDLEARRREWQLDEDADNRRRSRELEDWT